MALDDWTFYLNLICSIAGLIFFISSLVITRKIKKLFPGANITKKWLIIELLIVIFLIGYLLNIIFLAFDLTEITTIMTAIVYFFGGLFVLIIINLGYKTYKTILLGSKSEES
ncbi:MAG: hypothetical protein GF317_12180 [Candidatus Lokiarchaeota archaeon]|nr:hypothetical protein [Candidatus Lokiarchaeota archaeon]MBD3200405.1 hypothetical protein [Candidatus Lokiarchaeota archaeon]